MKELLQALHEMHSCYGIELNELANETDRNEVVCYKEVKQFLFMAERALVARSAALNLAKDKLEECKRSSREETMFLEKELCGLMEERASLQQRVQQLERENDFLDSEVLLLRDQLQGKFE